MTNYEIRKLTEELGKKYPRISMYESRCSLYQAALKDGEITEEQFNDARDFYDRIWYMS